MNKNREYIEAFWQIKTTYFPGWDDANEWEIVVEADSRFASVCSHEAKTVHIRPPVEGYILGSAIVHELAHAVTGKMHDEVFRAQLQYVADQAEANGDLILAEAVRTDVRRVDQAIRLAEPDSGALSKLFDELLSNYPQVTFDDAVEYAAEALGLTSKELLRQLSNARDLYEESRQVIG